MRRIFSVMTAAALAAVLTAGCGSSASGGSSSAAGSGVIEFESQTWQLLCPGSEGSSWRKAAEYFSDQIAQETNGAVTVNVSGEDSALTPAQGIQALMQGTVTLALYDDLSYAQLDPRFYVVSMPFLFDGEDAAQKALDGDGGTALQEIFKEYQLRGIGFGTLGFRCPTNSVRAVAAPADLRGLNLCVSDTQMLRQTYTIWGANPVSADPAMVYTALQTGTSDGQEQSLAAADAAGIQDVQKYVTHWTGIYDSLFFCMNDAFYEALPSNLRTIADRCGQEAAAYQRQIDREAEEELLSRWQTSGITVTELTKEETQAFRDASDSCYQTFSAQLTEELLSVFKGA